MLKRYLLIINIIYIYQQWTTKILYIKEKKFQMYWVHVFTNSNLRYVNKLHTVHVLVYNLIIQITSKQSLQINMSSLISTHTTKRKKATVCNLSLITCQIFYHIVLLLLGNCKKKKVLLYKVVCHQLICINDQCKFSGKYVIEENSTMR